MSKLQQPTKDLEPTKKLENSHNADNEAMVYDQWLLEKMTCI